MSATKGFFLVENNPYYDDLKMEKKSVLYHLQDVSIDLQTLLLFLSQRYSRLENGTYSYWKL
jgi:hypothetical protein